MIANNSEHNLARENTHNVTQRLNKLLFFAPVLEFDDYRIKLAKLVPHGEGGFHYSDGKGLLHRNLPKRPDTGA